MAEKQQEQTAVVEKAPKSIVLHFEGKRGATTFTEAVSDNLLTDDGKVDRNVVLNVGRMPDSVAYYDVYIDNRRVARMTRGEKQWRVTKLNENGEEAGNTQFDRSQVKKGRRKGTDPNKLGLDNGSDLLLAIGKVVGEFAPNLHTTSGRGSGSKSAKAKLNAAEQQIVSLLETLAERMGVSVEDAAKQLNMELPESYVKAHADGQTLGEIAESGDVELDEEEEVEPKNGKSRGKGRK